MRAIFLRHTALVEPLSLDEAYLDVTEELTGLADRHRDGARRSGARSASETGLTASAGVAPNKFLAKIASDWRKPDGLFVIRPHEVEAFLAPLPVGKLPGVGKATGEALAAMGIATVGDLAAVRWSSSSCASASSAAVCTSSPAASTTIPWSANGR